MPSTPLISVIVPVYKAEGTLKACVESIQAQSLPEIEVILINDGSPDKSGELCDEYARTDERIKVIHKENGGVSSARNAGLEVARGKYIGFVDSDDRIEPEMYERLYAAICRENAEIAMCGIVNESSAGSRPAPLPEGVPKQGGGDAREGLRLMLLHPGYGCNIWNKLFESTLFNEPSVLRFEQDISHGEDLLFAVQSAVRAKRIAFDSGAFYIYIVNQESASHLFSRRMLSEFEALRRLEPLLPPELAGYCPLTKANRSVHFACHAVAAGDRETVDVLKERFSETMKSFSGWKHSLEMIPRHYRIRLRLARVNFVMACRLWNALHRLFA